MNNLVETGEPELGLGDKLELESHMCDRSRETRAHRECVSQAFENYGGQKGPNVERMAHWAVGCFDSVIGCRKCDLGGLSRARGDGWVGRTGPAW